MEFSVITHMLWQYGMLSLVSACRALNLSHNKLTGVIPDSIGALLNLKCVCLRMFTLWISPLLSTGMLNAF